MAVNQIKFWRRYYSRRRREFRPWMDLVGGVIAGETLFRETEESQPRITETGDLRIIEDGLSAGATILLRAEAYWKAKSYDGSGDLYDESLNGHAAVLNGPVHLAYDGVKYVYEPGVTNNYVSAPDTAALGITGDIDLRAKIAADDWTPASFGFILGKWQDTASVRSYLLALATDGKLQLFWEETDSTSRSVTSSVATGVTDKAVKHIKATLDVDNGSGGHVVQFFTSDDGSSWSQLGTDQNAGAFTTSIEDTAAIVSIGARSGDGTQTLAMDVFSAEIRDGIDGTVVANPIFNDATSPFATYTDAAGNVWTFNRAATGVKLAVVDRPMFLLGTDDYLEVADDAALDFAADESLTVVFAGRMYDVTPAASAVLIGKTQFIENLSAGYELYMGTGGKVTAGVADGAANPIDVTDISANDGVAFSAATVRNVADDDIEVFIDGVGTGTPIADSTTVTLANAFTLRIGSFSGGVGKILDGEFFAAALFREALTDAEVAFVSTELLTIPSS